MQITKITLLSNNLDYGPAPDADEEVEQRLTIDAQGNVRFIGYCYGTGTAFTVGRQLQMIIPPRDALRILDSIASYFDDDPCLIEATDIGTWELTITCADGNEVQFTGALCGGLCVNDTKLTDIIRELIPIDELWAFGDSEDK